MRVQAIYNPDTKTLAITYRGETREFPAHGSEDSYYYAYNVFSTKFKTGEKLWPSMVTYWPKSGNCNIEQGGYSNRGGARIVVGWWNQGATVNTQSRGRR